ncbi:MAG: transposase [Cyanobacteria bacterium CRU_2_1]|nr:transposase [Cyanobacteria bacterium RU_5_0]NJR61368.1 transposase [Cyanobacteria bacterium CRU_2_1]
MTIAQKDKTTSKVETLARLYLESNSAEIAEETIATLCDWLMAEFQGLPLNLQFSDYARYDDAEAMFADIKGDHLWVSADSYDSDVYPNPIYGFILQAVHDYDHYLTSGDFSLEGEIAAYNAIAKRSPSLEIQKIFYSEFVLRPAAHSYLGYAPAPKIVFP